MKQKQHQLLKSTYHLWSSRRSYLMSAWQVTRFAPDLSSVSLNQKCFVPVINHPNEVFVKVNSSSVNPLDVRLASGYGHNLLSLMNNISECGVDKVTYDRVPVILGRDFSGVVLRVGSSVREYQIGDAVWGAIPPHKQGSHAQYVCTHKCNISRKPNNLSEVEAASLPYVALTAWSALKTFGQLNQDNAFGKKVLVLGGSGGVGLVAIQLLKHWGATVIATCSTDAVDFVNDNAGPDLCIDYKTNDLISHIGSFDFVLDATSATSSRHRDQMLAFAVKYLSKWKNAKLVTLTSPLLDNVDRWGLVPGAACSLVQAARDTVAGLTSGSSVRWAFFCSNPRGLSTIARLVQDGIVKPTLDQVFGFEQLVQALVKVSDGHARGKTVIDHEMSVVKSADKSSESSI